jgi:hypothetical protein
MTTGTANEMLFEMRQHLMEDIQIHEPFCQQCRNATCPDELCKEGQEMFESVKKYAIAPSEIEMTLEKCLAQLGYEQPGVVAGVLTDKIAESETFLYGLALSGSQTGA